MARQAKNWFFHSREHDATGNIALHYPFPPSFHKRKPKHIRIVHYAANSSTLPKERDSTHLEAQVEDVGVGGVAAHTAALLSGVRHTQALKLGVLHTGDAVLVLPPLRAWATRMTPGWIRITMMVERRR